MHAITTRSQRNNKDFKEPIAKKKLSYQLNKINLLFIKRRFSIEILK